MHSAIRAARESAKMTQESAAAELYISTSTIRRIEREFGDDPGAEKVVDMIRLFRAPKLKQEYCSKFCALGQQYEGEFLSGVPTSPQAALLKLIEEVQEVLAVIPRVSKLLVNARTPEDLTGEERDELGKHFQHIIDVQEVIQHLSICVSPWLDMAGQISKHKEKCRAKRYILAPAKKIPAQFAQA